MAPAQAAAVIEDLSPVAGSGTTGTFPSACPLDCPDACSLEIEVVDGRATKVGGSHKNPLTQDFICAKVSRFAEHVYAPERLLSPAVREGRKGEGRFRSISWDEAYDLLAGKLLEVRDRFGGEAILPFCYGGSNGKLTQDTTDARLFHRLGASHLERTVCAAPSKAASRALYGRMAGVALQDYAFARLIVLWGVNPTVSGIHLVPVIQEAQRNGAKLVVIDPRRTPLAKRADLHLAPRPGSDLALALTTIRWLFENGHADRGFLQQWAVGAGELERRAAPWTLERAAAATGLPVETLEQFARLYAASSPAVIRVGWGIERNRNGGSAMAAVLALPAVGGKFEVRGGGYTQSNSEVYRFDDCRAIAEPEPSTRKINMNLLGRDLEERTDPPVQLLFVYNCNPLATLPNQERVRRGLGREDLFTVVFDQVRTDTALYADLLLPATTFLEHEEIVQGYGALAVHRHGPVIAPVGEARPNYEVFAELVRRTGLERPGDPRGATALCEALLVPAPRVAGDLAASGFSTPDCGVAPVQFVDVFPRTPDSKVHLVPEKLDRENPGGLYAFRDDPATERFPLALLSPGTQRTISSSLGELYRRQVALEMNPQDAARRGLAAGDTVRVWNDLGEVRCGLKLSEDLTPGVTMLPKGLWSHNTLSGTTANALAPDTLTDLGGGACFNDARVEVEKG